MNKKQYNYKISCVEAKGHDIDNMVNNSKQITYETMQKHCKDFLEFEQGMYGIDCILRMKNDYAVFYYKSTYQGIPCYYLTTLALNIFGQKAIKNEHNFLVSWRSYLLPQDHLKNNFSQKKEKHHEYKN